jgi:P27 family predicted phage terminase small subunit
MRGRKPKAIHLRLLQGNRENRAIGTEPEFELKLPAAPDYLGADAREEWERLAEEVWRLGLLRTADVKAFEAYCVAYGRAMQAERALRVMTDMDPQTSGLIIKTHHGNIIQNPLVGTANQAWRDMVRYAVEFGLTPSARARIASAGYQPPQEASKFGGLLG